jgi:lipopolysaccharide export system protein LptA
LRAILPALLLLAPALTAAGKEEAPPVPKKKNSAISLLPNGSQLKGVMLPRYDENHRLSGVLKSKSMTLVTDDIIAGESVTIEFFNPDRSPRGRVDLIKALFNQARGMLEARESVTIQTDRIHAMGTGLIYAFEQGKGFLTGPATTRIQASTETTMNSRNSPRRVAAVSLLASTALLAAPPAAPAPQEKPATQADAAAPTHAETSRASREDLRKQLDASAAATAAATAFLEQAELASGKTGAVPEPAAPLDVTPGPNDTVVTCDGGMYFDADAGVFVYLKNVRVADPRFSLSGANELKIFLGKKPAKAPEPNAADKKPGIGLGAKFGNVERIVATGAVRILQKQTEAGKQPVEASGAIFTYQPETGEIVLTGGYPWVRQGTSFMRAKQPNLSLRIQKSGSFVTEGNWDMGGVLDQKR